MSELKEITGQCCFDCGNTGPFIMKPHPEDMWRYGKKNEFSVLLPMPEDFLLETCAECGSFWYKGRDITEIDEILKPQYLELLEKHKKVI